MSGKTPKKSRKARRRHGIDAETMSIPEAGRKYLGLSEGGSWAAARRGEIPFLRIGKLCRVPVRLMERMLDSASLK